MKANPAPATSTAVAAANSNARRRRRAIALPVPSGAGRGGLPGSGPQPVAGTADGFELIEPERAIGLAAQVEHVLID